MKASCIVFLLIVLAPLATLAATPDTRVYSPPAWSPYWAGAGIGVLTWLTLYFSKKPVGASSAYATLAGLIGKVVAPRHTLKLKYYAENPPKLDWELVFVGATFVGALIAAVHGGELTREWVPPLWAEHFRESSPWSRALAALAGGVLMAFGARMAQGCTSGHGISGAAQLNLASWIALVCFFVGGVVVANLLYRT